jgi:hypothetical protein
MTNIQRHALELMEQENLGCLLVKSFGWVWPTNIRNDHGRFGEERAIKAAEAIVKKLRNTSEMTYRERYNATTAWTARHIAKDLMEMNGPDEFISEHDDQVISKAENQSSTYLGDAINDCYRIMGL